MHTPYTHIQKFIENTFILSIATKLRHKIANLCKKGRKGVATGDGTDFIIQNTNMK
jgi:hypothetical protein